jgi:hypothetical protein
MRKYKDLSGLQERVLDLHRELDNIAWLIEEQAGPDAIMEELELQVGTIQSMIDDYTNEVGA